MGLSFLYMEYNVNIDQVFALKHGLTLTEAACLSAVFTLPRWTNSYCIDGVTFYWYSESKIADEFPLLFGCAKRVQKNIKILADKGFVILSTIGKKKVLTFTEKCWSYGKTEIGLNISTNEPLQTENGLSISEESTMQTENGLKTDQKRSETGPISVPYHYTNNHDTINQNNDMPQIDFAANTPAEDNKDKKTLFRNSEVYKLVKFENGIAVDYSEFEKKFATPEFETVDLVYYFHAVADWSDQKNMKRTKNGWLATVRNFIRGDVERKKLHLKPMYQQGKPRLNVNEAMAFLNGDF